MKRIVCSAFAVVLALGTAGCGESGDLGEGVPKNTGFVPLNDPAVSTDMSKMGGIKPPKAASAPKAAPAPAPAPAPAAK